MRIINKDMVMPQWLMLPVNTARNVKTLYWKITYATSHLQQETVHSSPSFLWYIYYKKNPDLLAMACISLKDMTTEFNTARISPSDMTKPLNKTNLSHKQWQYFLSTQKIISLSSTDNLCQNNELSMGCYRNFRVSDQGYYHLFVDIKFPHEMY